MTVTKFPRTSQPQQVTGIDWSNSLARGLVRSFVAGVPIEPVANKATIYGVGVTKGVGQSGPCSLHAAANTGVDIGASAGLGSVVPVGTAFTVSMLIRIDVLSQRQVFFADYDAGGADESLTLEVTATNFYRATMVNTVPAQQGTNSGAAATIGWHYITAVYTPSDRLKLFVDGRLQIDWPISGTPRAGAALRVGSPGIFGGGSALVGGVAFCYIHARALSSAEIQSLNNTPWQLSSKVSRPIFVGATSTVVSISRPTADVTTSGWTGNPDNVNLFTNINETTPSNSEFIESPNISGGEFTTFDFLPTRPSGTWDVTYHARFTGSSAQARIHLLDGSNVSQGVSAWQTVTSTFDPYVASVTTTGTSSRVKIEVQ